MARTAYFGREPRCRQDRLDTLQRDQLADEEGREAFRTAPGRLEEPLLGPDAADRHLVEPGELREVAPVCLRVGNDDVRTPERTAVDGLERSRGERARTKPPAIRDERVG